MEDHNIFWDIYKHTHLNLLNGADVSCQCNLEVSFFVKKTFRPKYCLVVNISWFFFPLSLDQKGWQYISRLSIVMVSVSLHHTANVIHHNNTQNTQNTQMRTKIKKKAEKDSDTHKYKRIMIGIKLFSLLNTVPMFWYLPRESKSLLVRAKVFRI